MRFIDDWRFFIAIYILCSGLWGLLAKIATNRLNPLTTTFIAVTSAWIVVVIATFTKLNWQSKSGVLFAATGGILGGISSLAFYYALKHAQANIVVPLSSLYIIFTALLSYIFLGEALGFRHIMGIILGLVAIILLTS